MIKLSILDTNIYTVQHNKLKSVNYSKKQIFRGIKFFEVQLTNTQHLTETFGDASSISDLFDLRFFALASLISVCSMQYAVCATPYKYTL